MGDQQPTRFLSKMCVYILIRFIIRRRCRIVFRRTSFICCPREDMILIVILHHTHPHHHVMLYDTQKCYICAPSRWVNQCIRKLDMVFNVQFLNERWIWKHFFQNYRQHLGAIPFCPQHTDTTSYSLLKILCSCSNYILRKIIVWSKTAE